MHVSRRFVRLVIIGAMLPYFGFELATPHNALAQGNALPAASADPLSLDDLSILFPVPQHEQDLDRFIEVQELSAITPDAKAVEPIFPPTLFAQLIAIADGPAGAVAGTAHRISLPPDLQKLDAWFIAGIRIDAGAPGLSSHIIDQYGQSPQIRLILQPVTKAGGENLQVHDTAVHLIFNFTAPDQSPPAQPGCLPRPKPDMQTFGSIIGDVVALRDKLRSGAFGGKKIITADIPLGVHPGLSDSTASKPLRDALKAFLERYLSSARLQAMAIMAIPDGAPEPWMFLSFLRMPPKVIPQLPRGGFIPVHGPLLDGNQFVEALSFSEDAKHVLPTPQNNNLNPITCKSEATLPPTLPASERKGAATAELFDPSSPPSMTRVSTITNLIADPERSNFFNADCISCHTETRRSMDLLHSTSFPHVDSAVLPQETWNVRNFGWFPSFLRPGHVEATVTRRTANETEAVVEFVNKTFISK